MWQSLSTRLRKFAEQLDEHLSEQDVELLNSKGPSLVKKVKDQAQSNEPFAGLSDEDKRVLLAFVVYKRQNITTSPIDNPNVEDAAKVLHEEAYSPTGDEKKDRKTYEELEDDLVKQLSKAGLEIKTK